MNSSTNDVQQAITAALAEGQELYTPARQSPFEVVEVDASRGIKINKLSQHISWRALSSAPQYVASHGGRVEIGARKGRADANTLEWFLQKAHGNNVMRGSFVAPILEEAGIIEILPKVGREKQSIRLRDAWRSSS